MVGDTRTLNEREQTCVWEHGRVQVWWPGKHGEADFRVEIGGIAVTHGELLAAQYGIWRAEDRYNKPGNKGRYWLRELADEIFFADDTDAVDEILVRVARTKQAACS